MRSIAIVVAALAALLMFPVQGQAKDVFQEKTTGADFALFPFWSQVLTDMASAKDAARQPIILVSEGAAGGAAASCTDERRCVPAEWTAFLDSLKDLPRREQVDAVNRWVNARPYVEDMANWGVADYWETPGEFLAHGGDCEDYAITKYFSLARLGFAADDLRLTIVKDSVQGAFHAVLAVRFDGETLLLDNQAKDVTPLALAARYTPVYSLNQQGFWIHALPRIGLGGVTLVSSGSPAH